MKKILIVDDEPEQIDFASTVLEDNGYSPIGASNGKTGMEKALTVKPDAILLDIMMPEKGGISMYQDLKKNENTKDIPVIVVTGVTRGATFDDRMMRQTEDIPPPDGYIEKPMDPVVLIKLIQSVL